MEEEEEEEEEEGIDHWWVVQYVMSNGRVPSVKVSLPKRNVIHFSC